MSQNAVTPKRAASRNPARAAFIRSSVVGGGIAAKTGSIASSFSRPVGSPFASRTIVPPGGSGVSRVMPASFSATAFASAMCPSSRDTSTGLSRVTASIICFVGSRTGFQIV